MPMRRWILGMGVIAALGCGGDDGQGPGDGGGNGDGDQVRVRNNSFSPATLTVESGTTVAWIWESGGTVHNVTFENDNETSGNQGDGTYTRTFTELGANPYHCTIHGSPTGGMRGTVAVVATGGDTGGGNGGGSSSGGGSSNGGGYPGY